MHTVAQNVEGTNGVSNTSSGIDCGPDGLECSDHITCCRSGESCCPDVDGNGVMECCPIEDLTDVKVRDKFVISKFQSIFIFVRCSMNKLEFTFFLDIDAMLPMQSRKMLLSGINLCC